LRSSGSSPDQAGNSASLAGPYAWILNLSGSRKRLICALLIFFAAAVGHMRSLRNSYVLDDYKLIVCNEFITEQQNARILLNPRYLIDPHPLVCGARPLTVLSLLVDYKFWQESPFGYHLTNILLHSLNSAAVFFLVLLILRTNYGRGKTAFAPDSHFGPAVFAALVFAFHPVGAEAVDIASFRADLLATFFYILSLIMIIKAVRMDRPGSIFYYAVSFILFVTGLFSKETVITLSLVFSAYVVLFAKEKIRKRTVAAFLACAAAAILFIMLFWSKRFYYLLHVSIFPNIKGNLSPMSSVGAYLSTLFLSFLHYGETLLLPFKLSIDYELNVSRTLLNPEVLLALVLFSAALWSFICYRNRLFRFGLAFWLICYLPVSNIFPLINTVNDRYMYLPLVGFSIALSAFIFSFFRRKAFAGISAGLLIAAVISAGYCALTLKRNPVFEDGYSLYGDAVKTAPTNIRVRYNLGVANIVRKNYKEALVNFEMVTSLNPLYMRAKILHLMGVCYDNLGDEDKAKFYYRWALIINPRKETFDSFASILQREGAQDDAAYFYKKSIEIEPDAATLNNLGIYYAVKKRYSQASGYFKKAIELEPSYFNAWANLVKVTRDSKDQKLAEEVSVLLKKNFPQEKIEPAR